MRIHYFSAILRLFCTVVIATTVSSAAAPKAVLLVARPVEASTMGAVANAWFSALTESYYRLRFEPVQDIEVLGVDRIRGALPAFANFGRPIPQGDLLSAAKSLGATYILSHNYEVDIKTMSVYYYLELIKVQDNQVAGSFENNFALGQFGKTIDEAIALVLSKVGVKPDAVTSKALAAQIVGSDPKNLQALGIAVFEAADIEPLKAAQNFAKITARDPKMGLAYYEAAKRFAAVGDNAQAAQMLDNLMVQCNVAYASLYAAISRHYRLNQSFERALHVLTKAEKDGFSNLVLALEKAQILEKTGKTAEALQAYIKVLSIDPDQPEALLLMTRRDRLDKKYAESNAKADRLIKLNKYVTEALREKGLSLAAQKQYQQAEQTLIKAAQQAPDDPEINVALGEVYTASKRFVDAAQYYEKALSKMPNNLEVLLNVSRSYIDAGRPQEALAVLMKNQQNFYTSKEVQREMGLLEFATNDTASARKKLEATLSLTPPEPRAFLALGSIYSGTGDIAKAITMYERAEALLSDKLEAQAALAKLHIQSKALDKAFPYVQKVLAVKADYPQMNRAKADVLFGRKDYKGALETYLVERKVSGNDAYLQAQVALCYYNLDNTANAELGFRKLIEMDPKYADGYYYLAVLNLKLGKLQDVQTFMLQAEMLGKADPSLSFDLAKAYAAKGQAEQAAEAYRLHLKANPKNLDAWLGLAAMYEKSRKDSLAAEAYVQAYQIDQVKNIAYLSKAGHLMHGSKQFKLARQYYNEFVAKKAYDAEVYLNNGRMAYLEKNWNDVVAMLAALKAPQASDVAVLRMLAEAYTALNKSTEALMVIEKLATVNAKDPATLEMAAEAYEKAGDMRKAVIFYQRYLALPATAKHKDYSFHLGELLEKGGQAPLAIEQYQKNISTFPADYRNHERLGELLLASNRITDITKILAAPASKADAPPRLSLITAQAYQKLGQAQPATQAYERYVAKVPQDSTALMALGTIYFDNKMFESAIAPLSKASVLMPKNTDIMYRLGMAMYQTKRLLEAADPLGRALAAGSKDPKVVVALSDCYRALKDTTKLIEVLQIRITSEAGNFEIANELGGLLVARGKLDEAITALEAASRVKPTDVGLHMQLVQLYSKKNDPKMQGLHINAALSYAPKDPDVNFAKAQFHLLGGQAAEARTYLAKTIELNPKHARAIGLYAAMLKADRKYREAFEQYNAASKLEPTNIEYMIEMAQCAHLTGRNSVALKVISHALELEPSNSKVLQWAGVLNLKEANEDKAMEYLMRAQQIEKNCALCDEYMGYIYLSRGDFAKAIQSLESAARSSDKNDEVMVKLARALALSGNLDRALELCNKVLAINPQNDEALYLLTSVNVDRGQIANAEALLERNKAGRSSGWIYLAQGRVSEAKNDVSGALSAYKLAARVLPTNSDMQMGLGRVYLLQKKYNDAIEAFGVASGLEPNNPQVFVGMGKAYAGQKDYASAKEYFKEALRVSPKDEDAHYMVASTAARQGESMEAITAAKKGVDAAPKSGKLHLLLAELLGNAKQFSDALSAYDKAARLDQSLAAAAFKGMGDIYYRHLKDPKNARRSYTKHLEAGGKDASVRQALTKLESM